MIDFRNVSFSYPDSPDGCLNNIVLTIPDGQFVLLCGRNSAGKTTFSRALYGLHKELSGQYPWNGTPQKPKARMQRSYMVMQDVNYQLFAESVEAECTFGIRRPDTALADKTLDALGLAPSVSATPTPSPADRSSDWPRPPPWSAARSCWYSTSPPAAWTTTAWCGWRR